MLVFKDYPKRQLVSVLFQNQLSQDISHIVLDENEEEFQQLFKGNFQTSRIGNDVLFIITSKVELARIRQITKKPMFIKF